MPTVEERTALLNSLLRGELSAVDAAKVKWWSAQVQNEVLDHWCEHYQRDPKSLERSVVVHFRM